jgi:HK97 family phage major capsid protein
MPELTQADVANWPLEKVTTTLKEISSDVMAIRERNGNTLVGVAGDDAVRVQEHLASSNVLGERRDELMAQADTDGHFVALDEYLNKRADNGHVHPAADGNGNGNGKAKLDTRDAGAIFLASEGWRDYALTGKKDVKVRIPLESVFGYGFHGIGEVPTSSKPMATLFDSSGFPSRPDYFPPVPVLYQENNIGPLMAQGSTDSDTIVYPVETVTATGAAETAEGDSKPEAQLSFADTTEPLQTIAVLLPVTNKALRNQAFLRAYLNARLRLFVQNREDSQLLTGNGTTPNIKGLLNRSGINTSTSYSIGGSNPDQALIDAIFHASMRVRDAFVEPTAAAMKPSTWEIARLAKDGNRNYLLGPAADMAPQRVWGLRVVLNANMPAQSATNKPVLVGAFDTCAMVVRRGGIDLAVSDSHSTFFGENKVMLRAEEELALCVFRPAGFATVTSAA